MQANHLTITAFGPYCDRQTIDFRELGEESMYLITGPTGAGKTTVFDAICYALYGKASGSDRDQDSLRSHFAATDLATEVSFLFTLKEKKYQVTRSPRQQKKKERGEGFTEEPAKAELYEIHNEKKQLLSAKIKDVNETLEEKLGLDYEQFRKMIMIPQGEFRRLISENSKEREEILQRIFHTHFYERFTEELKKQAKELRESIRQADWRLEQELRKIEWQHLVPEETDMPGQLLEKLKEEINRDKTECRQKEEALDQEKQLLDQARTAYHHGRQIAEKFTEQQELQTEADSLARKEPEMEKNKHRFHLAGQAARVLPAEQQVAIRKKEWETQKAKTENQKKKAGDLDRQFRQVKAQYEEEAARQPERERKSREVEEAKKELEALLAYRELYTRAGQLKKEQQKAENNIKLEAEAVREKEQKLEEMDKQLAEHHETMETYYQSDKTAGQAREQTDRLKQLLHENQVLQVLRQKFQQAHQDYEGWQTRLKGQKEAVQKIEKEWRDNHAIYLAEHLEQGISCPVCGSKSHPRKARGETTDLSLEKLERLQAKWEEAETAFAAWQQEHYLKIKTDGQAQRQLVEQMYREFQPVLGDFDEEKTTRHFHEWDRAFQESEKQKKTAEKRLKLLEQTAGRRKELQAEIRQKKQRLEEWTKAAEMVTASWLKLEGQAEQKKREVKNPSLMPEVFQQEVAAKEAEFLKMMEAWETLSLHYQEKRESLQQVLTVLEQQEVFQQETESKYETEVRNFREARQKYGFETMEDYQQAKLPEHSLLALEKEIEQFYRRQHTLKERLQLLESQLECVEKPDLTMLSETVKQKETKSEQLQARMQELQLRLKQHNKISEGMHLLRKEQESLRKQYADIGELADLARGENHLKLSFERYVLSSFLEEILLQANIRLDQMTEHRYHLVRSNEVAKRGAQSGLDLEVLDHHTGQQRSVKTLSGGEGFKAALSLALGMADVVQAHAGGVQLDTLFIDEGFGTLDELSLEQAIDCLKGLQQSNRVLGIISHVPQLKEEILAKLQITPSPRGSEVAFSFR